MNFEESPTPAELSTRPASEEDAALLARLTVQLGCPSTADQIRRRLSSVRDREGHDVVVAEREGAIVGWIHVFASQRLEADAFAEIGGLVVDSSLRGKGVGSALLREVEAWALRRGFRSIRVRSNVIRAEAHEFYRKRGYAQTKQQAVFDKNLRHERLTR